MSLFFCDVETFELPPALMEAVEKRKYEKLFDLEEMYELAEGYFDYTDGECEAELVVNETKVTLLILDRTNGTTVRVYSADMTPKLFTDMDVCYSHAIEEHRTGDDFHDRWEAMLSGMKPMLAEANFENEPLRFDDSDHREMVSYYNAY